MNLRLHRLTTHFVRVTVVILCTWGHAPLHAAERSVADIAVDAFALGAPVIGGIPITETEKILVKSLVNCGMKSSALLTCAREELIKYLPRDLQPVASCIAASTPPADCLARVARLPEPSRTWVGCVARADQMARCGQLVAPPQVKAAMATIEKLRVDARSDLATAPQGPIRNIIRVAEGIRDDDWGKVLLYGGVEVYKYAVKVVLNVLLPGLAEPIDKITDAVVQSRVDLVTGLIKAAQRRDQQRIAELSTEFYLMVNLIPPCALVPPGEFRKVTCGNLGEAIKEISKVGGELTDFTVRRVEDALDLVGIDTREARVSACGPATRFYVSRYMKCLHRGTYVLESTDQLTQVVKSLNNRCHNHYNECHKTSTLPRICEPLNERFHSDIREIDAGLKGAARLYMRSMRAYVNSKGTRTCAPDFDRFELKQYIDACESSLRAQIPLVGDPSNPDPDCKAPTQQFAAPSAHRNACERALPRDFWNSTRAHACKQSAPLPVGPRPEVPSGRLDTATGGGTLVPSLHANLMRCKPPYVWRAARPDDLVCVTDASRLRVREENRNAHRAIQPGTANTCRPGLVWREAFVGDTVCVSELVRDRVRRENAAAAKRRVGG